MSRDIKYIGMDVHKEATVIAVLNGSGKLVMESIVETKAGSILQFIHGLRGELHVTWEEGTWAAWLYDLLQPQVHEILVCNPRRNALLKEGSKSDKVDARKLADLLRTGMLRPVYHGEHGLRTLRELARSYQTISQDLNRVMNRVKALYRGWSIPRMAFYTDLSMSCPSRASKLKSLTKATAQSHQKGLDSEYGRVTLSVSGTGSKVQRWRPARRPKRYRWEY